MKTRITVTKESRKFIAKAFKVTERTVFNALSGERDNDLARRIRKLAKAQGGVEITVYDEFETMHDADGYIRQYFPNGAMLEIEKGTDQCAIFHKGEKIKECTVTFANIGSVQTFASALR